MQSYEKYKKYKLKYLKLKYLKMKKNISQNGGDKPVLQNIDRVNRFRTGTDIEKFLNPIYGLYTCENGFIENNYHLYDAHHNNTQHTDLNRKEILGIIPKSQKIHNITRDVLGVLRPNIEISEASARDIGRYIGLLYFNKHLKYKAIETTSKGVNINFIKVTNMKLNALSLSRKLNEEEQCILNRTDKDIKLLTSYIAKNKLLKAQFLFSPSPKDELLDFHILLYCLWWNLDDDNEIDEYYKGIDEVFTICNRYVVDEKNKLVILNKEQEIQESFESILVKITQKNFHIYNFGYAKDFCNNKNETYPDCGETTLRNFINLLCYDGQKFDTTILAKYGAIEELIEYYTTYNNFSKQSVIKHKDGSLNARDKWSELIILNSNKNNNVSLKKKCVNQYGKLEYEYEVRSLMSKDVQVTNFFQIIMNLFKSVKEWEDFLVDNIYITQINNNVNMTGVGTITITRLDEEYMIECENGHYYMKTITPKDNDINFEHINNIMQKEMILALLNKNILTEHNCYYRKWSSELICNTINDDNIGLNIRQRLLELSYLNMYDPDTRRRIKIDTRTELFRFFAEHIVKKHNGNNELKDNLNNYTYKCINVDFVNYIPSLKTLNCEFVDTNIQSIDLSPLQNIEHIGDDFLLGLKNISKIDLTPLRKINEIGDNFLSECFSISEIDLSPLVNVTELGMNFMSNCIGLTRINSLLLPNLQDISIGFMKECSKLTHIDLSSLVKIQYIDNDFLKGCSELEHIKFPTFTDLKAIYHDFMYGCKKIKQLVFDNMQKLETIGSSFLYSCGGLERVTFPIFSNLEEIEHSFMSQCKKIQELRLLGLEKLKRIGATFLYSCSNLERITFSILPNLLRIDNSFMIGCKKIQHVRLLELKKLTYIGTNFMSYCKNLNNIELIDTLELKNIDSLFLNECSNLEHITFSTLVDLMTIESKFMFKCMKIRNVRLPKLDNLSMIGEQFMEGCKNLINIEFENQSMLNRIGNNFLNECSNLEHIRFPTLEHLTSIKDNFMSKCIKIQNVQLPSLMNAKKIGDNFMEDCINLNNIEFVDMTNMRHIGNKFLNNCSNLEHIRFPMFPELTSIGSAFMGRCKKIQNIQLLGLNKLDIIGNRFMYECEKLKTIDMTELSKLESIEDGFLYMCTELENVNLSNATGLPNLTKIRGSFMNRCDKLERVQLLGLNSLTNIFHYFMNDCINLRKIEFTGLSSLTDICPFFAYGSENLEIIDLSSAIKLDFDSIKTFAENCPKVKILKPKLE